MIIFYVYQVFVIFMSSSLYCFIHKHLDFLVLYRTEPESKDYIDNFFPETKKYERLTESK